MESNEFQPTETPVINPSPVNTAMKYGLMAGVLLIILTVIFYMMNYMPKGAINVFPFLIIGGFTIYGCINYREEECGGFLSYGSAFKIGVLIALFASIILGAYNYVFYQFIDPSYVEVILAAEEESLNEKNLPQETIDKRMELIRSYTSPMLLSISTIIMFLISGLFISLITSIFVKKEKPFFDTNR